MSEDHVPAPIEALVRAIAGGGDDDDHRATTFARGLALGALVGAAIAGSTIWQRRRGSGRPGTVPLDGGPATAHAAERVDGGAPEAS